jgi:hypothetical protein
MTMEASDLRRHERQLTAACGALQDDAAFDAEWDEGRGCLDHAVAACVELLTRSP